SSNGLVEQHLDVVATQEVHAHHEQDREPAHHVPGYARGGGDHVDLASHALTLAENVRHLAQDVDEVAAGSPLDGDGGGKQASILALPTPVDATKRGVDLRPERHFLKDLAEFLATRSAVLACHDLKAMDNAIASAQAGRDQVKRVG